MRAEERARVPPGVLPLAARSPAKDVEGFRELSGKADPLDLVLQVDSRHWPHLMECGQRHGFAIARRAFSAVPLAHVSVNDHVRLHYREHLTFSSSDNQPVGSGPDQGAS